MLDSSASLRADGLADGVTADPVPDAVVGRSRSRLILICRLALAGTARQAEASVLIFAGFKFG